MRTVGTESVASALKILYRIFRVPLAMANKPNHPLQRSKFAKGVETMHFYLSSEEQRALENAFVMEHDTDMVNFSRFASEVAERFEAQSYSAGGFHEVGSLLFSPDTMKRAKQAKPSHLLNKSKSLTELAGYVEVDVTQPTALASSQPSCPTTSPRFGPMSSRIPPLDMLAPLSEVKEAAAMRALESTRSRRPPVPRPRPVESAVVKPGDSLIDREDSEEPFGRSEQPSTRELGALTKLSGRTAGPLTRRSMGLASRASRSSRGGPSTSPLKLPTVRAARYTPRYSSVSSRHSLASRLSRSVPQLQTVQEASS